LFGILLMYSTARFASEGWIADHYVEPIFHFKYYGFKWVQPLNLVGMYLVHLLLFLAALFVTLGLYYRWATVLLFLSFTYTELIDLTYYLNHYYFVSLVCFLLILLPANRAVSLDVRLKNTSYCNQVPAWTINSLKLMIAIVYIYAGLAKINTAWLLDAMPLKLWLSAHDKMPILGGLFAWEFTPYLFSWFGMLFDTTIIFFLLYPKTRKLAFIAAVIFHAMTGLLFQIGVFPLVMIAAVSIFFSPNWHQKILTQLSKIVDQTHLSYLQIKEKVVLPIKRQQQQVTLIFLALFFGVQLLFPWRYILYDSNVFWSEEGYRFSWRVMLMEKSGNATFYIKDGETGKEGRVINSNFLNKHQEKQMAMQPDMILQYAHFLGAHYKKQGVKNPKVRAEVYVTLNGAKSRLFFDEQLDLMKVKEGWGGRWWIEDY
ncbi:MAG: HTTM domain-containing protein, partial [Bacteroidota bacterium]